MVICGSPAAPTSRPVWGAWIEIVMVLPHQGLLSSRAPYGARGLKCDLVELAALCGASRPVWGAWIEICWSRCSNYALRRRAPYGARGLKYIDDAGRSARQAVAPRMGRVD